VGWGYHDSQNNPLRTAPPAATPLRRKSGRRKMRMDPMSSGTSGGTRPRPPILRRRQDPSGRRRARDLITMLKIGAPAATAVKLRPQRIRKPRNRLKAIPCQAQSSSFCVILAAPGQRRAPRDGGSRPGRPRAGGPGRAGGGFAGATAGGGPERRPGPDRAALDVAPGTTGGPRQGRGGGCRDRLAAPFPRPAARSATRPSPRGWNGAPGQRSEPPSAALRLP